MTKITIILGLALSFSVVAPCFSMEYLKLIGDVVGNSITNGKSVATELKIRAGLGLERKEEVQFNLAGTGVSFIASLCATSYGLNNLFKKDSSKAGALLSIIVGIGGIGYTTYNLHLHGSSYKPYIE